MNKHKKQANDLIPGSAMHPGILLKQELTARKIRQTDLAKEIKVAKNVMSEIVNGKRSITASLAVKLENALGISAAFWMKHQSAYEIDKIRIENQRTAPA